MRRKIVNALLIGMVVMSACSCGKKENENVTETTGFAVGTEGVVTEAATQETTAQGTVTDVTDATDASVTETEIRALVDENLNCMRDIFVLGMLPTEDAPIQGEWIYQVKEDIFRDYAEFESYVRSVYCKETADMYLYDYPYEGEPKYVNIDGKLCANKYLDGGRGYYVDWTDYALTIESVKDGRCQFTVTCLVEWPAENPVAEEYPVSGEAIYENGRWLLTEMLY